MRTLANFLVFIASPRGLDDDRSGFRSVLSEYNESEANPRGVHFTPVGWEETLGRVGRPQETINEEVRECDYFVLLLHDRWGSPPAHHDSTFTSGAEEEFHVALQEFAAPLRPMRGLVLFFKAVDPRQLTDPGEQLKRVLAFRKEREENRDILFHTYDEIDRFKAILRRHLAQWVREHEEGATKQPQTVPNVAKTDSLEWRSVLESDDVDPSDTEELVASAERFAKEGKIVQAESLFSRLAVGSRDPWGLARYGGFLRKTGQLGRAKAILERAIELAEANQERRTKAYASRQLAHVFEWSGEPDLATEFYLRAVALYDSVEDLSGRAKTLRELGLVLRKRGKFDEAIRYIDKSLKVYQELGDEEGVAAAFGYLGLIYRLKGSLQEAEDSHRKALEIHQRLGGVVAIAIVESNLAVIYRTRGELDRALELHRRCLQTFLDAHNLEGVAREHSNIGTALRLKGLLEEAQRSHEDSLAISEELGNRYGSAIQYSNLGAIERLRGNLDGAEVLHRRALEISRDLGDDQGVAIQYENMALVQKDRGDLFAAERGLRESLAKHVALDAGFGVAKVQSRLVEVLTLMGRLEEARELAEEAKERFSRMGLEMEIENVSAFLQAGA